MSIKETQRKLSMLGLYTSTIDGIDGPKTQAAQSEFKEFESVSGNIANALSEKIDNLPVEDYSGQGGFGLAEVVKKLCTEMYHTMPEQWACIMATVEWETAGTFYPVEEAYYLTKAQQDRHLIKKDYYPYFGRGLVQLTWEFNYKKYSEILNIDLVTNPEHALDTKLSLFILVHGMLTGTFTGKSISRYINSFNVDYEGSRRVVNGTDKARQIAELAEKWEAYYA